MCVSPVLVPGTSSKTRSSAVEMELRAFTERSRERLLVEAAISLGTPESFVGDARDAWDMWSSQAPHFGTVLAQ